MKKVAPIEKFMLQIGVILLVIQCAAISATAKTQNENGASENEKQAIVLSHVWQLESVKKAVILFKTAAAQWQSIGEQRQAVFCLNQAAILSETQADYETAFDSLNSAINLENKFSLKDEKIITASLFSLFSTEKSRQQSADKFSYEALLLSRNSSSPLARAYAFFGRGMYEYYYGKMSDATELFEKASASARSTQDIFIISQTLFYVGYSYLRNGKPYLGIEQIKLALSESEQFNYRKGIALSYFGLAYLNYYLNERQKALELFKKAGSMFPEDFEWLEKARIDNGIGQIYMDFGDYEIAESNFRQAIQNYEQANYTLGKVTTLTMLADTYSLESNFDQAVKTYQSAAALSLELNDRFRLANIKQGLGIVAFKKNEYDDAIKNYLLAQQIYEQIGVKIPEIKDLLGKAYQQKHDFAAAERFYQAALQINRQTEDNFTLSETLFNYAALDLTQNKLDPAFAKITESIDLTEKLYTDFDNNNLKKSYFSNIFDRYSFYIRLLMEKHRQFPDFGYDKKGLQASEKSRARLISENIILAEADLSSNLAPEIIKQEREIRANLSAESDKLTDLLSNNINQEEINTTSRRISILENQLEEIKSGLKQTNPIYSAIKNPAPFDVEAFQRDILDDKSVLLEFSFGQDESYLWLVGKDSVESFVLPPREQIETRIEKLRTLLESRGMAAGETIEIYQARIAAAEREFSTESKELSRDLFGQIADKIAGKRLIVVPDGKLHYFPIAALPLPNSESDEPILLTNETVYEPSAATLALLTQIKRKNTDAAKNLLVFSDPIFSAQDSRIASNATKTAIDTAAGQTENFRFAESLSSLARLNGSKDEADSIIEIVGATGADDLTGASATRENALDAKIGDYKIIHFATHGLIKEDRPELSGIVLSQFDEKGNSQNGVVRLQDIYAMNLNAELVVLSACSTGIGKEVKGEGLMSLNNAFLQSGAKTVVSSLWKVDDEATRELMKNFYREMAAGDTTTAEALRRAQIALRKNPQYQSPFYWAAFTAQGDFKNAPKISGSVVHSWLYGLLVIPFALGGIYAFRRRLFDRKIVSES